MKFDIKKFEAYRRFSCCYCSDLFWANSSFPASALLQFSRHSSSCSNQNFQFSMQELGIFKSEILSHMKAGDIESKSVNLEITRTNFVI